MDQELLLHSTKVGLREVRRSIEDNLLKPTGLVTNLEATKEKKIFLENQKRKFQKKKRKLRKNLG
jgi:hypothetical protein